MTDETCGADTPNGPCKNPATEGSHCWIETHGGDRGASKFNEDRKAAILDAAENGTTVEGCARAAGVGQSTLYEWLDQYPEFSDDFNRARARGEQTLLASEDVSAQFILERSYGYVKTEKREVDMDADHNIDAAEGVTAEFVTFTAEDDGDE